VGDIHIPTRLLAEIDRHQGVPHGGRLVEREAVRGIILRGAEILLIHSKVEGDYKFPGGGVNHETHYSALKREIAEESGAELLRIKDTFGCVIEYAYPIEKGFDAFKMTSYYYVCEIDPQLRDQHLDAYEAELGFTPQWIDIDAAIQNNEKLKELQKMDAPRWLDRETTVLKLIRNEIVA
jgi:8-oxo-dGTP diphosphatase